MHNGNGSGNIFDDVSWSLRMCFVFYIFGIAPSIHVTHKLNPVSKKTIQTPTLWGDLQVGTKSVIGLESGMSFVLNRFYLSCWIVTLLREAPHRWEVILYRFNALQNPPKQTLLPNSSPGKPSVSLEKRCRHATPSFMPLGSTFSAVIFSTSTKAFAPSLNSGFFAAILEHLFWETGSIDTGEAKKNPANLSQRVYWLSVPRANGRYPAKHDACQQKNPSNRSWRGSYPI